MPDATLIGAIGAALAAGGGALASIFNAARSPADIAALKAELAKAREEVSPAVRKAIDAVVALLDPDLRRHLDAVVMRLGELETRIERYRSDARDAPPASRSVTSTAPHDMGAALDHERRLTALEKDWERAEIRAEKDRETMHELRVTLAGIVASMEHLLERRRRGGGP